MTDQPIPSGFTRHDEGPCPVGAETRVEIIRMNGHKALGVAKHYWWHEEDMAGRNAVEFYRVIPAPAEPTPDAEGGAILEALQDACCQARNTYQGDEHGGPDPDEHWARVIQRALPGRYLHALANPALRPSPPAPEGEDDKHEREMLKFIDERDAAEEALSQAYYLVIGRSPEWSNVFGHAEALEEIDNAQRSLRLSACPSVPSLEDVRGVLEPFARLAKQFAGQTIVEVCQPHPSNPSPRIAPLPVSSLEAARALLTRIGAGLGVELTPTTKDLRAGQAALTHRLTPGHPDAYLNAILDYSLGLYGLAAQHGVPARDIADAVQHMESAARGLHALARHPAPTPDAGLVEALRECQAQFEEYAAQHRRKATAEGYIKAATNDRFAAVCRAALSKAGVA